MKDSFILVGASVLGKIVLERLINSGHKVLAYADNNIHKQGTIIDGLSVHSLSEATKKFPHAIFVITIFTHSHVKKQVSALGVNYLTLSEFALQFKEIFLPFLYLDSPEKVFLSQKEIAQAMLLWSDSNSLTCYVEQIYHRMTLKALDTPFTDPSKTYFDDAIFTLREDEVFINCGAYDGDTIKVFLEKSKGYFNKIYAIEPDNNNFSKLSDFSKSLGDRIELINAAAFNKNGSLYFNASGDVAAAVTNQKSGTEVTCCTIDSVVKNDKVTLIQMDIEGSERQALEGCGEIIKKDSPVLVICLYHRPDDIWEIPLQIYRLNKNYNFYLKRYSDDGWELVLYAVPKSRAL